MGGGRGVARVVRARPPPVPARAVGAAAGAAPVPAVRRVAPVPAAPPAGAHRPAAAAHPPPLALLQLPRRLRPDRQEPNEGEGHCQCAF